MAYKVSIGKRGFGDINFEDDADTGIDFEADTIKLETGGAERIIIDNNATTIANALHINTADPTILFKEGDTEKATIGINSSDNILIENKVINKHIVFKVNDQGVVREGFRINGTVPEVVVNEGSDSLVDFRVESNNSTHMLFVDGGDERVGIKTNAPFCELDVQGTVRNSGGVYRKVRDEGSTSNIATSDYVIRCIQNGAITLTLPAKSNNSGQIIIVKDALGNAGSPNNRPITIAAATNETIDGQQSKVINTNHGTLTIICDGINGWMVIGSM